MQRHSKLGKKVMARTMLAFCIPMLVVGCASSPSNSGSSRAGDGSPNIARCNSIEEQGTFWGAVVGLTVGYIAAVGRTATAPVMIVTGMIGGAVGKSKGKELQAKCEKLQAELAEVRRKVRQRHIALREGEARIARLENEIAAVDRDLVEFQRAHPNS